MPENVFSKRVMSAFPCCLDEHLFDILNGLDMEVDEIVTAPNLESDLELSIETIKNPLRRAPRKLKIIYRLPLHRQPLKQLPNTKLWTAWFANHEACCSSLLVSKRRFSYIKLL